MFNRRGKLCFAAAVAACLAMVAFIQPMANDARGAAEENKPAAEQAKPSDFKKLKSPMPNTRKSIARGRSLFVRICAECHGPDGKAEIDLIADATDLTRIVMWRNGHTEGEIFQSIRDGAGEAMPPYKLQIKNEKDIWHLVNFIRNLWPKDKRPKIEEEKKNGGGEGKSPSGNGEKEDDKKS